jgi:hypothetical protein
LILALGGDQNGRQEKEKQSEAREGSSLPAAGRGFSARIRHNEPQ